MHFIDAVGAMRHGKKVALEWWSGKKWITYSPGTLICNGFMNDAAAMERGMCSESDYLVIWRLDADSKCCIAPGWLPTLNEILSENWVILE